MILIELAVESLASARAAATGGADRIELCAELAVGGLTPSDELTRRVLDDVDIPVFAMVRPRAGDFTYSSAEIAGMCATIEHLRGLGVHGIVTGVLTDALTVDMAATTALMAAAAGLPVTFHRAFDRVSDQAAALEQLVDLGVTRVLTSGGAPTALEGSGQLRKLVALAAGRIAILAGGGIREANARDVLQRAGVRELHSKLTDHAGEELTAERMRALRATVD